MSDIRKWFIKQHDKGTGNVNAANPAAASNSSSGQPSRVLQPEISGVPESAARRKTSKYFDKDSDKPKAANEEREAPVKRKIGKGDSNDNIKTPPAKKVQKTEVEEDGDDFAPISAKKKSTDTTPSKKLKGSSGRGVAQKNVNADKSDDEMADEETVTQDKSGGRGRGGRGASNAAAGGRGRGGGGRGGFMNFGERKDPPHKGEKEVPEGTPDCLAGFTFVISGTLDSLEREEAEDLIKRHGGRVTGSVSKKTTYLLCDEDIEGRKSAKAKELGTKFLSEDALFAKILASKSSKMSAQGNIKKPHESTLSSTPKKVQHNVETQKDNGGNSSTKSKTPRSLSGASPITKKDISKQGASLTWTEKYKPKTTNDIVGNQSTVKDLHKWLSSWEECFLHNKGKGKKQSDSGEKKAVLMCGTPGIGKTTSAKLVTKMLGYETIEVNASDSRGKADSQIGRGIGGSTANSIKELISNESLSDNLNRSKHRKSVLIMDEVDGMSAGDRGGVADLISSIKVSKIPIICICNDRYSQKLKSLIGYCLVLNFRKPTKQQMAKRLMQIANSEGIKVKEIAMEELAERCNGDIRMAVNQLYYMSLSMSAIEYDDVKQRFLSSSKDEDISPFTAVDKLFGFNGGKLRMDERVDLGMSDFDLVPLIIQENYINYQPNSAAKDVSGMKRMDLLSRAAESIADGDIINVQIRRYRQWQLSQSSCVSTSIIPASLMHGQREILSQGERNFNRFGGWLGKNSTSGKNFRNLESLHVHMLSSSDSYLGRGNLRLDYLNLVSKQLTHPLRALPKDEAVRKVVEFMDAYSLNMEDYDTLLELSKFQGRVSLLDGVQPAVKAALTRAYNEGSKSRVVRTADLITLPGMKKRPKKRIAAILEPVDELNEEAGDLIEDEEGNPEDEELDDGEKKPRLDLQTDLSKGIQVQMELKSDGKSSSKTAKRAPAGGRGRGRGSGAASETASGKRGGRGGSGAAGAKRKR